MCEAFPYSALINVAFVPDILKVGGGLLVIPPIMPGILNPPIFIIGGADLVIVVDVDLIIGILNPPIFIVRGDSRVVEVDELLIIGILNPPIFIVLVVDVDVEVEPTVLIIG